MTQRELRFRFFSEIVTSIGWPQIQYSMVGHNLGLFGDHKMSSQVLAESLEISQRLGDRDTMAWTIFSLSCVALYRREFKNVQTLCRKALLLFSKMEDRFGAIRTLEKLAIAVTFGRNQEERATHLFGALENLRSEIGWQVPLTEKALYEESVTATRNALGDLAFDKAWRAGRTMTLERAILYALES